MLDRTEDECIVALVVMFGFFRGGCDQGGCFGNRAIDSAEQDDITSRNLLGRKIVSS
jgi:hypothetical protein